MKEDKINDIVKLNGTNGTFFKIVSIKRNGGFLFRETIPATENEWNVQEAKKQEIKKSCIHFRNNRCSIFFLCEGKCDSFDDFNPMEAK